jgi:hypothetical protein
MLAESTEVPEPLLASKYTSSEAVGAGALLPHVLQDAQLVEPVAFQLVEEPPPRHHRPTPHVNDQPLLPETLVELPPAYQVAPPVAAESLIDIQSTETMPEALESVAADPGVEALILARLPEEPLAVNPDTVCVVPLVRMRPLARPALFTAMVLKVLDPVTVMLSPVKVMLL